MIITDLCCYIRPKLMLIRFVKLFLLTAIIDILPGIKEGQQKMSKSDPSSAIFMEDDEVFIMMHTFFIKKN